MKELDRAHPPESNAGEPFHFPEFTHQKLATGLEVYALRRENAPLVSLQLVLPAGAHFDPAPHPGLAAFAASLLEEGTTSLSSKEIADRIESIGGTLSTGAGWATASIASTVLTPHLETAFELLADVATNPAFQAEEIERTRRERLAEWLRRRDQPTAIAEEVFASTLYGEGVYGHTLLGDQRSLQTIGAEEISTFWRAHSQAHGAFLLVAGDVEPARVLDVAVRRLGELAEGPRTEAPLFDSPPSRRQVKIVDRPDAQQTEIRIGHVGPRRSHRDRTALSVLNSLLGGKFTSRINLNLRERNGYTYGAHSAFIERIGPAPFLVWTAVANDVAGAASGEILHELSRLREEAVSEEELLETRNFLQGVFPYGLQTNGGILRRLQELAVYDLPDDYFDRRLEEISTVDEGRLLSVARSHIDPDSTAIVAVGPATELAPQFQHFGEVEVLEPVAPAA